MIRPYQPGNKFPPSLITLAPPRINFCGAPANGRVPAVLGLLWLGNYFLRFLFLPTDAANCFGFFFPAIFGLADFFTRSFRLAPVRGTWGLVRMAKHRLHSLRPCGPATTGMAGIVGWTFFSASVASRDGLFMAGK